jgi:hypothetical protein
MYEYFLGLNILFFIYLYDMLSYDIFDVILTLHQ